MISSPRKPPLGSADAPAFPAAPKTSESSEVRGLPLQIVLVLPFVLQILAAVGLVGYLSYRNGQQAVNNLASQLRTEISGRIDQRLRGYLKSPHVVNRLNAEAYTQGDLDLNDTARSERYFWRQVLGSEGVSSSAIGTAGGRLLGANPSQNYVFTSDLSRRVIQRYKADAKGNRINLIQERQNYDLRERTWYRTALQAGQPTWTQIDASVIQQRLDLTAVYPLYTSTRQLRGVFYVDVSLDQIGEFLRSLNISPNGQAFVLEPDGNLVASSAVKQPFQKQGEEIIRINALKSDDTLLGSVAKNLNEQFGQLSSIAQPQQLTVIWKGEPQFVQVTPFKDEFGLNWLTVVVVPEADFMEQINASTRTTILLCLAALGASIALGIFTARRITRPILRLSDASKAIAEGRLDQKVGSSGVYELGILSHSFNEMAAQMRESFIALEKTNAELEQRVEQRTSDLRDVNAAMQEDSEALQAEVGHILEVVSAVEEGNLTVEAQVSSRATGLVADTLNRLIEQLSQVIAGALSTAQQVSQGAEDLEQVAVSVSQNAQQQAHSVTQVQALIENVNSLSQDTAQQSTAAADAVHQAQTAVLQGQQEMSDLTSGIGVLQHSTEQMVRRVETLGDFVRLASQFVQDQKRVASLTQVLAMNASMIAARAAGQQDPEQFASVAHEFETVAAQVNNLAVQTSQSLILLQQRTGQIQTVVSGIDQDVREVSNLVGGFTSSVKQSNQVFSNLRTVTEQVAQVSQTVTQSGQAIAAAAQTTLHSIRDIAAVADRTAQQARVTREQSGHMGDLARILLDSVLFFRLPEAEISSAAAVIVPPARPLRQIAGRTVEPDEPVATSVLPSLRGNSVARPPAS